MVLIDTHILLWILSDSRQITEKARKALDENDACISIASLWEMAIKASLKKAEKRLELEETIQQIADRCVSQGIDILPITPTDCEKIRTLPHHHEDPFDRIIIAQASTRDFPLITKDENIWKYGDIEIIW